MKLIYKRAFDGDLSTLPTREVAGAVQFREPENMQRLSLIANAIALVLAILFLAPVAWMFFTRASAWEPSISSLLLLMVGMLLAMPLHELLHAVCFRETVEFYTCMRLGLMFVVGTESMTRVRFVFMSLLPNLVFGALPYLLYFLFFPGCPLLGVFGAIMISCGAGDYYNVFHALTQMPKGALCFMSGMHSFWYQP